MVRKLVAILVLLCLGWTFSNPVLSQDSQSTNLLRAVPEKCLMMSWWDYRSPAPENSQNKSDQMFAEPEVRRFVDSIFDSVGELTKIGAAEMPGESREKLAVVAQHLVDCLFRGSGCFFMEAMEFDEMDLKKMDLVLLLNLGDQAKHVSGLVTELMETHVVAPQPVRFGEHELIEFKPPEVAEAKGRPSLFVGSIDGQLLVGVGRQTVQQALERLSGKQVAPWVLRIQERIPIERRISMGYLDVAAVRDMLFALAPPEVGVVAESLGLGNIESLESSIGYGELAMTNRMLLRFEGKPTGIFELIGKNGIKESSLDHIPSDALFVIANTIELGDLFDFAAAKIGELDPRMASDIESGMDDLRQEIGVDIRKDLLGQIGPVITLHNGSSDGLLAGLTLTAELRDSERFANSVNRVGAFIMGMARHFPDAPIWINRRHGNETISTLVVPEAPFPFEISFCIKQDKLIVALYPQVIRTALLGNETPLFKDLKMNRSFGPDRPEGSLAGLIWIDTARQFEWLYPMLQMGMAMRYQLVNEAPPQFRSTLRNLMERIELPPARSIHKHLIPSVTALRRVSDGFEMESQQTFPMMDVSAVLPLAAVMIPPAVQQARVAGRRSQSMNNLRQMALAILNYESAYRKLPSGFGPVKPDGPAVSWRVAILPFFEQNQLYDRYRMDEPWNSENNLQVLEQMPEIYRSPNSNAPPNHTVYLGVGGRNGIFGKDAQGKAMRAVFGQIIDGTSNTAMFVEAGDGLAVPWTKPDEGIDPENFNILDLLGQYPGGFLVGMADASVRFVVQGAPEEALKYLFKMSDRQIVPFNELFE